MSTGDQEAPLGGGRTMAHDLDDDKRRINRSRQLVRFLSSFATWVGLAPSPRSRKAGISALVRMKDEETWIEASLRSSRGLFDEYVVVDNASTDRSRTIVEELQRKDGFPITLLSSTSTSLAEVSNLALHQTQYRWIIRWDGDFIAWTGGPRAVNNLRNLILSLPTKRHAAIFLTGINVVGDLWHHFADFPIHSEEYLFTYLPSLHFVELQQIEALRFPKYYSVSRWKEPWFLHVNAKPMLRLLYRNYWNRWVMTKDYHTYPTLDSFVQAHFQADWGTDDVQAAASQFINELCRGLTRYDPAVLGEYPEILRPYLDNPTYQVVYKDEQIIGRNDGLSYLGLL